MKAVDAVMFSNIKALRRPTVKHEIFAAVKFCGFFILNFSQEDIFADF